MRNTQREQRFLAQRNQQAALLAEAKSALAAQRSRGASLAAAYDANEKKLAELTTQLDAKAGNLGEMFGVVRQVANDFSSVVHNSLISAQFPDREEFVVKLSQAKALPSMPDLERFWFELQREMTESGRVARFQTKIVTPEGTPSDASVVRVGAFNATASGTLPVLSTEPEAARGHAAPAGLGVHVHRGSGREGHRGLRGRIARSDPRCPARIYAQRPNMIERIEKGRGGRLHHHPRRAGRRRLAIYQLFYLASVRGKVRNQLKFPNSTRDRQSAGPRAGHVQG